MITAKIGDKSINCYDGELNKETLKKWANKNIILCPICGKSYEYCHGDIKHPYFRHKEKANCTDKYSEPETEEHIKGKIILYKWLCSLKNVSDVILEGWIAESHQRPDIMFKIGDKQFVIEFQCSPIATEYNERHKLYETAGIIDIWIIGKEKYTGYKYIASQTYYQLNIQTSKLKITKSYKQVASYFKHLIGFIDIDNFEINGDEKCLLLNEKIISEYMEEDRKQKEIERQEQLLSQGKMLSIQTMVEELNSIYSQVKNNCVFKYEGRCSSSPYISKITFKSDIVEYTVFFIKEEGIDVCITDFYKKPYFGWSSKRYTTVKKGYSDCIKHIKIDGIKYNEFDITAVKKYIHDYIILKLRTKIATNYKNRE